MRQLDLAAKLAEECGIGQGEAVHFLSKTFELIENSLILGEVVNTKIGLFFPLMFSADKNITWEEGPGPLAHIANRNRDRVIPIFEWDMKSKLFISDYTPTSGPIGDRIRAFSLKRTKRKKRSKAYLAASFSRARAKLGGGA